MLLPAREFDLELRKIKDSKNLVRVIRISVTCRHAYSFYNNNRVYLTEGKQRPSRKQLPNRLVGHLV